MNKKTFQKIQFKTRGGTYICVIHNNSYDNNFCEINDKVSEALCDFPDALNYSDIKIVIYGGNYHKYQYGIEFTVDEQHNDYQQLGVRWLNSFFPPLIEGS